MARYISIPSAPVSAYWWQEPNAEDYLGKTVYEAEEKPVKTGLLAADGVPIYRMPDERRIGFVCISEK